jgi:plasmid stabilization system protein ParE
MIKSMAAPPFRFFFRRYQHPIRSTTPQAHPAALSSVSAKSSRRVVMPRGDKGAYTGKQKRKAEHIAEGYEDRGVSSKEAKSRAWATVNKESGGGKKSGSGRGKTESHASSRKGGRKGGATSSSRSAAAKKGWETRRRRGNA